MRHDARSCYHCKHSGADPDGPYCAHPKVLEKHAYGLAIDIEGLGRGKIEDFCKRPELPLWEKGTRT